MKILIRNNIWKLKKIIFIKEIFIAIRKYPELSTLTVVRKRKINPTIVMKAN